MLKNKSLIFSIIALLPTLFIATLHTQSRLHDFDFGSASVLPFFFKQDNKKYFILAREAAGKAESKGTYDDFGGSRERNWGPQKNQPEPYFMNAGHEFLEEALLQSIGFSLRDTVKFININGPHTKYVVAFSRNVGYIVDFNDHANNLFNSFYAERKKLKMILNKLKAKDQTIMTDKERKSWERQKKYHWARLEKDSLAIVECETLKNAIAHSKRSTGVMVQAYVLNPENLGWNAQEITLRPFFVKKLRPFFMDKPYQQGENQKIGFYDLNSSQTLTTRTSTSAICAASVSTISSTTTHAKASCTQKTCTQPVSQKPWLTRVWNWITSYTQ